jgi:hypothetical protein
MPDWLEPRIEALPVAQQEIWPLLAPARGLSFVLYGGTAIALHLGHRISVDFDFFSSRPLDKKAMQAAFAFWRDVETVQEDMNTLVINAPMPSGAVRVSFFGGLNIGRINQPRQARGTGLLIASLDDLLATKLETILDRAEAKDYRDVAAMLSAGVALDRALGAFKTMYGKDPGLVLRAMGFFRDGDLASLSKTDQALVRAARDSVSSIPVVPVIQGSLGAD